MFKHIIGILSIIGIGIGTSYVFANSNSSSNELHWGFVPSKGEQPIEMGAQIDELMARYDAIYKGDPTQKVVYLTFDNGYENGFTESILDTLKAENVPATFFLTGHYLESATPLVQRMVADGHIIGNHSYNHPNMAKLSEEEILKEWKLFDEKLKELTKVNRTYYARPPEGIYNERVLKIGIENNYRHIFWSIAFKDWDRNSTLPASYAYDALMKQLHPGAIILMHSVARHNAEALPQFIKDAKAKGYTFASIDDLVMSYELEKLNLFGQ